MSMSENKLKVFAYVQLGLALLATLTAHLWCDKVLLFSTDLCWLIHADINELERAFVNYYSLIYLAGVMLKYGFLVISLVIAMVIFGGKQLRENLGLSIGSAVFTLVLAEVGLRLIGYIPGQFQYSQWVEPVDSLISLKGFTTDADGALKVDTLSTYRIWRKFPATLGESFDRHKLNLSHAGELVNLATNHLSEREPWKYHELDSILQNYVDQPINKHGFYSIPFDSKPYEGPKVLLLGDSFTWGHSTSHKSKSFSNCLLHAGYNAYNTGISGTDVQQYQLVLEKYFEVIRPDIVVLNFFLGNDISYFKRRVGGQFPPLYHTNAGVLMTMQNGVQFTDVNQCYQNIERNMKIPSGSVVNDVMRKTVITTFLWELLVTQELIDHEFFVGLDFPERDITNELMEPILFFCDSVGVPLVLSVIPELVDDKLIGAESVEGLFRNLRYHQPKMTIEMYNPDDGHFNDQGHKAYADYLQNLIDSCFQKTPLYE